MRISLVKVANYPLFAGLALSLVGIVLVTGVPWLHPQAMAAGAAFAFPTAMFLLFTSGYKRGGDREGAEALLALLSMGLTLAALILLAAGRMKEFVALGLGALALLLAFSAAQVAFKPRWPHVVLLTLPPLMGAVVLMIALLRGWGLLDLGLALGLYYAAPMITSVSLLTSSRNYGSSWHPLSVSPPLAASLLGLVLLALGSPHYALASSAHLLLHFASIRLWGALEFRRRLVASKNPYYRKGGMALILSHLAALSGALVFALLSTGLLPPGSQGAMLALIHAVYLGFIAPHIHYHAVTMLPQITPLKPTRLFLTPALLLWPLATLARLYQPHLGLLLVVAALTGLLAEFKPHTISAWVRFLASTCSMPHACRGAGVRHRLANA